MSQLVFIMQIRISNLSPLLILFMDGSGQVRSGWGTGNVGTFWQNAPNRESIIGSSIERGEPEVLPRVFPVPLGSDTAQTVRNNGGACRLVV